VCLAGTLVHVENTTLDAIQWHSSPYGVNFSAHHHVKAKYIWTLYIIWLSNVKYSCNTHGALLSYVASENALVYGLFYALKTNSKWEYGPCGLWPTWTTSVSL